MKDPNFGDAFGNRRASVRPFRCCGKPAPREGDGWRGISRFHIGEIMPELGMHYAPIDEQSGLPVLMLHGTAGFGGDSAEAIEHGF
jgi:hypothetical protein